LQVQEKVFDGSFSSANARLLPSAKGISLVTKRHQETQQFIPELMAWGAQNDLCVRGG